MIDNRSIALPGVSVFSGASAGCQDAAALQHLDERLVDPLDPVVPLLVVPVDRALDRRDLAVVHVRAPRDVLLVPEPEVEFVLLADRPQQAVVGVYDLRMVPLGHRLAVQLASGFDKLLRVQQHHGDLGGRRIRLNGGHVGPGF